MKVERDIFAFSYVPAATYANLAKLANAENWGSDYSILKSYIRNLYKRISQKLNSANAGLPLITASADGECVCFDTGLYTDVYERIFAYFEKNLNQGKQPWCLKGYYRENDKMMSCFSSLPTRVIFYDDPADLVFDSRLEINVNYDHILGDPENVNRFPKSLQGDEKKSDRYRVFKGSVDEAKKRVTANYMLAVPQFFTDKNSDTGRVQLLIPLCLEGDNPDLALTVERGENAYSARTCLTLKMAYNNARLINKPEAQWLALPTK